MLAYAKHMLDLLLTPLTRVRSSEDTLNWAESAYAVHELKLTYSQPSQWDSG